MLGGAVAGGLSGAVGGAIAGAGGLFYNTMGIAASSFTNSLLTNFYTGGKTPVSISFGAFSYDITNDEWGYLFKSGNKWYENVGYGLGALANVSDILTFADNFMGVEDRIANKANTSADWFEQNEGHIKGNLDQNYVGKNLNGTSYMGSNNPRLNVLENELPNYYYGRVDNWGYKEYAAYLHDIDYKHLNIGTSANAPSGSFGLFLSNRTIAADWSLAGRQLFLSAKHFDIGGVLFGGGMASIAAYKSPLFLLKLMGVEW